MRVCTAVITISNLHCLEFPSLQKKNKHLLAESTKRKQFFFPTTRQFQRVQQKDLMSCDHCCRRVDNLTLDNKRDTELDATDGIIVWKLHVLTSDCIKQLP